MEVRVESRTVTSLVVEKQGLSPGLIGLGGSISSVFTFFDFLIAGLILSDVGFC